MKTKKATVIRTVFLSDLHTGNPRIPAAVGHDHLRQILYPQLINNQIDLLVIGGDFFHTLLSLNSVDGFHAILIAQELLMIASRERFLIRVLRGTFSHDRYQNRLFLQQEHNSELEIEHIINGDSLVKIIDTVTVEHINSLNIDLLFVPDDLAKLDVYDLINQQLQQSQLTQVDMVFSHGYFEHLLPKDIPLFPPNTLSYNKLKHLVKGVVLNGHVHTPSIYHNVVSGGSFERFQHGEEEDKGFFIVDYDRKSHQVIYNFIKNDLTLLFKAIDLVGLTSEEALAKYKQILDELLSRAKMLPIYVQLLVDDTALKHALEAYTKENYPDVVCSSKKRHVTIQHLDEIKFSVTDLPLITEQNLAEMIYNKLQEQHLNYTMGEIEEVLNDAS